MRIRQAGAWLLHLLAPLSDKATARPVMIFLRPACCAASVLRRNQGLTFCGWIAHAVCDERYTQLKAFFIQEAP